MAAYRYKTLAFLMCFAASGCGSNDESDGQDIVVSDVDAGPVADTDATTQGQPESIIVALEEGSFTADSSQQLTATLVYENGQTEDVTSSAIWTSSDESVARFNSMQAGMLDGISPGQVTVTASYDGLTSDPVGVEITPQPGLLTAEPNQFAGLPGDSVTVSVQEMLGDDVADISESMTWSSADESIVTMDGNTATIIGVGTTQIVGQYGTQMVTVNIEGIDCQYPANNGQIAFNEVFPDLFWEASYLPDGTQINFSMRHFHCSPRYADKETLIIVLGAGWCAPCSRMTRDILNPRALDLLELGAEILYLEAQDTNYELATTRFAYRHIGSLIDQGPGIRSGELDTQIYTADGTLMDVPGYVQQQAIVTGFPSVWVLRKRDMRLIADQGRSNYYLPFELICADPEADWSDPPPPPFRSNCEEGDEELSEPNNTAQEATRVEPGVFEGGICDAEPDFYRFTISGPWRARLEFDSSEADLDMLVYDKRSQQPVLDENGRALLSNGTGDVEEIVHQDAAILMIYGYNRTSTSYTLTIEAL
ncbi:MAG: Ig-like domain-containing protein [Myxococcota bacterium]|nr:Ig-like domain-containing protein [Myxococcota bacterium]